MLVRWRSLKASKSEQLDGFWFYLVNDKKQSKSATRDLHILYMLRSETSGHLTMDDSIFRPMDLNFECPNIDMHMYTMYTKLICNDFLIYLSVKIEHR